MRRWGLEETVAANCHYVYLQLLPLSATDDFKEVVKSVLENRPAQFRGS